MDTNRGSNKDFFYTSIAGVLFRFENIISSTPKMFYVVTKSYLYSSFFVIERSDSWEIIVEENKDYLWNNNVRTEIVEIIKKLSKEYDE